jgi:hypothetical protein
MIIKTHIEIIIDLHMQFFTSALLLAREQKLIKKSKNMW